MNTTKLDRIRRQLTEAETQRDKYSQGTTRRNDWEREVQRLKNIEWNFRLPCPSCGVANHACVCFGEGQERAERHHP